MPYPRRPFRAAPSPLPPRPGTPDPTHAPDPLFPPIDVMRPTGGRRMSPLLGALLFGGRPGAFGGFRSEEEDEDPFTFPAPAPRPRPPFVPTLPPGSGIRRPGEPRNRRRLIA